MHKNLVLPSSTLLFLNGVYNFALNTILAFDLSNPIVI